MPKWAAGEVDGEGALALSVLAQHILEAAKVEKIIGLIAAQVQVDGAVGRLHRLLQQQQGLHQGRLARGIGAQQQGQRLERHLVGVVPGLEVLEAQVGQHGFSPLWGRRSQASSTRRAVRYSPWVFISFSFRTRKVSEGSSSPITAAGSRM